MTSPASKPRDHHDDLFDLTMEAESKSSPEFYEMRNAVSVLFDVEQIDRERERAAAIEDAQHQDSGVIDVKDILVESSEADALPDYAATSLVAPRPALESQPAAATTRHRDDRIRTILIVASLIALLALLALLGTLTTLPL
jgi:hypothetical protein